MGVTGLLGRTERVDEVSGVDILQAALGEVGIHGTDGALRQQKVSNAV